MSDRGKLNHGFALLATLVIVAMSFTGRTARAAERSPIAREPLTLAFVANEGVLVASGQSKVLIDALFDRPNQEYRPPSPGTLDDIMAGRPPFDGVGLLLVTHDHPDHFAPGLVARYLKTFPSSVLLAPADAVAKLRSEAEWRSIEARVVSLDVRIGDRVQRNVGRFSVTSLRTLHSGDSESPANLVHLVEINGWRVFHEGDSAAGSNACLGLTMGCDRVDLALVHFWFPLEPNCARFLQEELRPDHIALMHLPVRLESDAPGKVDKVRRYYRDLFLLLPDTPVRTFRRDE